MMHESSIILSLKKATTDDAQALFPVFSEEANTRYTNFKTFEEMASFQEFLQRFFSIHADAPLQYGPYLILLGEECIGLCGLQQRDEFRGTTELWYILDQKYWGKGWAKKAVLELLSLAGSNPQLKNIEAEAVGENIASWKILMSLGFEKLGEQKEGFVKNLIKADLWHYRLTLNKR